MYILLNREDVVIDILHDIRYIKLLPENSIVISCSEGEGTGVIGSDCNTHYALIKADITNNPNAVRVLKMEEIPSNIVPKKYKYDLETNSFICRYTLDEAKDMKQEENKALFAQYLTSHPLTWVDGKEYGITEEDQSEISLNLSQYQIAVEAGIDLPTLEWHAKHEECKPWILKNLTALSLDISNAVYPIYHTMQKYKTAIYACNTIEEIDAITLKYGDDENEETTE